MDLLSLLRTLGSLALVLAMLAGALWVVRRYDLKLPGRVHTSRRRRIEIVERLSIDAKRSVALIRRDDAEHLILIAPDGNVTIESGVRPAFAALVETPAEAPPAPPPSRQPRRQRPPRGFGTTGRWNRARVREALGG